MAIPDSTKVTLRGDVQRPLTYAEMDENFDQLKETIDQSNQQQQDVAVLNQSISNNKNSVFESLKRSYAEAGLNLVDGSFEEGGVLSVASDVMITSSGDGYSWGGSEFPHNVAPGSTPTPLGSGGWIDRSDVTLRGDLARGDGAALVGGMLYAGIRAYSGAASKIQCLGKAHIFDGGAGDFRRDDSDSSSADNGITTLVDAQGRRWKRVYDGVACVEWAEGSSDRLMIKKALAAKIPLQMKAGSDYVWDGTDAMEIDVGYTSLSGNSSRITFSGFADVATESAIKFISTRPHTPNDYWVPQNTTKPLSNLVIIGPKGTGVGAAFSSTCVGLDITMPHLNLSGLFIYGFGHGFRVGAGGYCLYATACNVGQCANGVTSISGASDYGESIEFFGCKIYDNAVGINNNCQTGVVRMIGGSLDYNIKQVVGTNSSTTELTSTWFECNDAGAGNVHIDLSGWATFRMTGGHVQQNGTPGALSQAGLVHTDDTSKAAFRNVHMFNTRNTANVLDSGTGLCLVEGTDSYPVSYLPSRISSVANNLLSDGGFATSSVSDMWYIADDTAAITDRLDGANVNIALSDLAYLSGAKSLQLNKISGGAAGAIAICVPITPGCRAAFTGSYYKPAGALTGGTVFVTTQAVKIEGVKANGCPNVLNSIPYDTLGIGGTDSEIPWTSIGTGMDRIMPSWATHFLVVINAQQLQGDLYFDDWNISTM